ncbi:MAG: bifunctional hydroxymethylpyrimidine kinase/phosphomethylpyrimidine kinase [Bacteroidales bacterium]|nr:bifunctional hydroxymethylpyrimidine kinase/phosphomethylpyrimidine kinase [Bacteroidales bacterium]
MKKYNIALTIAGTDPSGGAGVQADLKTFSACGCYGTSAITALVDQNTTGVKSILPISVQFVADQIRSVIEDTGVDAIKIGMLHSAELVEKVQETLIGYPIRNIVLDPVMVATSGDTLLKQSAIKTLKEQLIPCVRIITPNIPEAEILLGKKIKEQEDLLIYAKEIAEELTVSVLLKAGHLEDDNLIDVLYNYETEETIKLPSKRIYTPNTHGTGCTLSSAITAFLARGYTLNDAVINGKEYITEALVAGSKYKIGAGHGPVHHFYKFWK